MIVRYVGHLVTLARAAIACNVKQRTPSAKIKQLEESLSVLIVKRPQRFVGFTPEGTRVLAWANSSCVASNSFPEYLDAVIPTSDNLVEKADISVVSV